MRITGQGIWGEPNNLEEASRVTAREDWGRHS